MYLYGEHDVRTMFELHTSLPLLLLSLSVPPSGMQANATGRSAKSVREFLEKHYSPEAVQTRDDTVLLAVKALLEVVQSGSKSMELAVIERGKQLEVRTCAWKIM